MYQFYTLTAEEELLLLKRPYVTCAQVFETYAEMDLNARCELAYFGLFVIESLKRHEKICAGPSMTYRIH